MGRKDVYKGIDPDSHLVPGTDLLCQRPDFGPEVIVATVPW